MPANYLHGVELVEIDTGTRPIRAIKSSVIGVVGTAPDADAQKWPLNTPVLVAGRRSEAAGLGTAGTLAAAIDDIFDQIGAMVVVIRVEDDADPAVLQSNVMGGIEPTTGAYEGIHAFLAAESTLGVTPRILVAPEFSQITAVAQELQAVAERLRAVVIADGPNTTDAAAIAHRDLLGSDRVFLIDPWVKVWDSVGNAEVIRPASARVAGVLAKSDDERGFWWSPSNRVINGVLGTARPVDFAIGDGNARANLLNEKEVATIVQRDGFRLWGNRTTASDAKWAFLKRRRVADMIGEAILQSHLWAVDRNVTRQYLEEVVEGVNAYGRHLITQGALVGFRAWANPELNTPEVLEAGQVFIDYDWVETPTAERLTFRSMINNGYLTDVLPVAA